MTSETERKASLVENSGAVRMPVTVDAAIGLAIVRVAVGAMFLWVAFQNLQQNLYTPGPYSSLIQHFLEKGHSPAGWKSAMGLVAAHASVAAPVQGVTEVTLGILLLIGLFTRPAAVVAFLFLGSIWISEWGIGWIWAVLMPMLAALGVAVGSAGRKWGVDGWLDTRKR